MDESAHYDASILAADALGHLIKKHRKSRKSSRSVTKAGVVEKMYMLLDPHQPPIIHKSRSGIHDIDPESEIATPSRKAMAGAAQ